MESRATMTFGEALGRGVFRLRGLTPVPLALAAVLLSWRSHIDFGPGGQAVDEALNAVGLACCLAGSVVRFITIALVPAGTSGNGRTLAAAGLNTTGPYAVVRHPLYLGNALIVVGLLSVAHAPIGWALGLGYFGLSTALIVRAEERLLEHTFPDAWRAWAQQVPRFRPRWSALATLWTGPFNWRRAMGRELNTLGAWGLGLTALFAWEWWARGQLWGTRALLLRASLVVWVGVLLVGKLLRQRARARAQG